MTWIDVGTGADDKLVLFWSDPYDVPKPIRAGVEYWAVPSGWMFFYGNPLYSGHGNISRIRFQITQSNGLDGNYIRALGVGEEEDYYPCASSFNAFWSPYNEVALENGKTEYEIEFPYPMNPAHFVSCISEEMRSFQLEIKLNDIEFVYIEAFVEEAGLFWTANVNTVEDII